jgi:hypothetical protein
MMLTVEEVFEAARTLPREQRAELTEQLFGSPASLDPWDGVCAP